MIERLKPLQHFLEKKIYVYIKAHIIESEIFMVGLFIVAVIGKIPYLNILVTRQTSLVLLIILAVYLFEIEKRLLLMFSLFLFACALIVTLAGKIDAAESIGTMIYVLLWFVSALYIKDTWRSL